MIEEKGHSFSRRQADNWCHEVPGVRWFKADLCTHTIDDAPSGLVWPVVDTKTLAEPEDLRAYARQFLDSTIANGVQILGVTPYSPRSDAHSDLSAAWQIVEEWNSGCNEGGVPYREQIFAVFPGFMPSLKDGRGALRLIFLFDPEIGRDRYLQLFDLIMQGKAPWNGDRQATTDLSHSDVFDLLDDNQRQDRRDVCERDTCWDYLMLAPDVFSAEGLFGTPSESISRNDFNTRPLGGLQLSHDQLPEDVLHGKQWVKDFVVQHHLTFFHSSGAFNYADIGQRHVWVKMASPTIEALRQAFVASESRVRCGHELGDDGDLQDLDCPPDATRHQRPWLRRVKVSGKASFFSNDTDMPTRFDFSPDLTCIIGGSMTGKSTLLDGLRVHVGASLPLDDWASDGVIKRAENRLLAGSAVIELDCPGRDQTIELNERWPATFYTQGELQSLSRTYDAIEGVLARLDSSETAGIEERNHQLSDLDKELKLVQKRLTELDDKVAEAEQALARSESAFEELAAFSDAGVNELNSASSVAAAWNDHVSSLVEAVKKATELDDSIHALRMPDATVDTLTTQMQEHLELARSASSNLQQTLIEARNTASAIFAERHNRRDDLRENVDRILAEQGVDGSRISKLQALNAQASLRDSYESNLNSVQQVFSQTYEGFQSMLEERHALVAQQRESYDRVIATIQQQFQGGIAAKRIDNGNLKNLEDFLLNLNQRGITRWWNDHKDEAVLSPDDLLQALSDDDLRSVGMSDAVQNTFRNQMTLSRCRELAAIRCPDRYVIEFQPEGSESHLPINELSGGKRINLLLSLLLEADDVRPLVIDQPEDELDNRFLFETLLPALRRLKGRRQVILATHNANIVVNGDADQIIHLDASARRGHVAASGAIEEPVVRDSIIQTVDGGEEAFRLRRLKYGF